MLCSILRVCRLPYIFYHDYNFKPVADLHRNLLQEMLKISYFDLSQKSFLRAKYTKKNPNIAARLGN